MRRLGLAIAAFWTTLLGTPFFDAIGDDEDRLTDAQWAGMIILHAEAVHGCEHTEQARADLGMSGPRGKAAA